MDQTKHFIFTLLTNPKLERYRVYIPYPIYVGFITSILCTPLFVVFLLRGAPWQHAVLAPVMCGAIIFSLNFVLSIGGFVSGYRPFKMKWENSEEHEILMRSRRLMDACKAYGFDIVWTNEKGSFVAVLGLALEAKEVGHAGTEVPVRVSLMSSARGSVLKVQGRTVVLWDTGEKERMKSIGQELIKTAGIFS